MIAQRKSNDPNSVANSQSFVTRHIKLIWNVDFEARKIVGSATLAFKWVDKQDTTIKLDCSHLHIKTVTYNGKGLDFHVDERASQFGGMLSVTAPAGHERFDFIDICIEYETGTQCTALQWLRPEQTAGKVHPYLFSQCQAIHARSMLPCQDTPAVKATYTACVSVVKPLTVVMSANRRQVIQADDPLMNKFYFEQTLPIPSYLIAIGAGAIKSRSIGPRSSVWCEEQVLEAAAFEFAETESFISTAEQLVGEYVWERYDILLLPPSFPYGGMENPCLTFLTPSLICGDRSLVDVVAHEIAHSWTGNLVSCINWENFWLNEGFTMFLERKILARIHGESWRQFNSHIGLADLRESVAQFKGDGPETALIPDLSSTDPDDVFSSIPYEKGYTLLYVLEELVGGPSVFEPFFKAHIQNFAQQSINSHQFKAFLVDYFSQDRIVSAKLAQFDWDAWFYGRGMPPTIPKYSEQLLEPCRHLAQFWQSEEKGGNRVDYVSLSPAQKTLFLDLLLQQASSLRPETIVQLDQEYSLSTSNNVEILLKWFLLCIRTRTEPIFPAAAQFATLHGRMKYCRPIFRELFNSGPVGQRLALDTFTQHRSFFHPIAAQMICKDLKLDD